MFDPLDMAGDDGVRVDDSKANCPAPGVYQGVPLATYHGWDACSNGRLADLIDRSPAFCRMNALAPYSSNTEGAGLLGDATHAAILEPAKFEERFEVAGPCAAVITSPKSPRKGEKCGAPGKEIASVGWVCGTHSDDTAKPSRLVVLPQAGFDLCRRMRDAVWADDEARELLAHGLREVSLVWTDPITGLRCKARPDNWHVPGRVVVDVKTTSGGTNREAWSRILNAMGYYRQAPWYLEATANCAPLMGKAEPAESFAFVVVENTAPHEVAVYELGVQTITAGLFEIESARARYAECRRRDDWASKINGVPKVDIPEWRLRALIPRGTEFEG